MGWVETKVRMDQRTFWKLAAVAERFDMRVDQYLVELASVAANRRSTNGVTVVGQLWRTGMTDKEIAAEIGWTNTAVAEHRRSLGLSANRKTSTKKAGK